MVPLNPLTCVETKIFSMSTAFSALYWEYWLPVRIYFSSQICSVINYLEYIFFDQENDAWITCRLLGTEPLPN